MFSAKYKTNYINLYEQNIAIVKKYNDDMYKLTLCRSLRKAGIDIDNNVKKRGKVNDKKLKNNISRAKQKIIEYALCNSWAYFCTLTLNKDLCNRYDLRKYVKKLSQYIKDLRKKGYDIRYLLIPEKHKDGAWHLHGFFNYAITPLLKQLQIGDKMTKSIAKKVKQNFLVYEWTGYNKKFGFSDFELIKDSKKCAFYVTKYITKDLSNSVTELNAKLYYCSKGLRTAQVIMRGRLLEPLKSVDFENEYVKVKYYKSLEELPAIQTCIKKVNFVYVDSDDVPDLNNLTRKKQVVSDAVYLKEKQLTNEKIEQIEIMLELERDRRSDELYFYKFMSENCNSSRECLKYKKLYDDLRKKLKYDEYDDFIVC